MHEAAEAGRQKAMADRDPPGRLPPAKLPATAPFGSGHKSRSSKILPSATKARFPSRPFPSPNSRAVKRGERGPRGLACEALHSRAEAAAVAPFLGPLPKSMAGSSRRRPHHFPPGLRHPATDPRRAETTPAGKVPRRREQLRTQSRGPAGRESREYEAGGVLEFPTRRGRTDFRPASRTIIQPEGAAGQEGLGRGTSVYGTRLEPRSPFPGDARVRCSTPSPGTPTRSLRSRSCSNGLPRLFPEPRQRPRGSPVKLTGAGRFEERPRPLRPSPSGRRGKVLCTR